MASFEGALADLGARGTFLAQKRYNEEGDANNYKQAGGIVGLLGQIEAQQQQRAIKGVLAGAGTPEEKINALSGMPGGAPLAQQLLQIGALQASQAKNARETAFNSPANLAQYTTPGQPAVAAGTAPPDAAGGGPPVPFDQAATPGQLDYQRLLQGKMVAGLLDPLAYAKEQNAEIQPKFAPSRSPGYFQNGQWVATPENQPAPAQSQVAKLIAERDALPASDPRRSIYDQAITHQTNPQQQRIIFPPQPHQPQWLDIEDPTKPGSSIKVNPAEYNEDKYKAGDRSGVLGGSKASATGAGSSRENVFINRVILSGNEAARDLENVVKLPMTASAGMFGLRGQGEGILNAGKETLANKMTTQEVQSYNVLSSGFQRSLAAIESAGLAPSGKLSHQMDAVIFREGDTNFTKLQKLAQTRQIVEAGLETISANPRVPEETRKHVEGILKKIEKSVPFTNSDLIELQQAQRLNPKATLKDVVRAQGQTTGIDTNNPLLK